MVMGPTPPGTGVMAEAMIAGLENGEITHGDVIVIRYEGPTGGPGMPEMLTPTSAHGVLSRPPSTATLVPVT